MRGACLDELVSPSGSTCVTGLHAQTALQGLKSSTLATAIAT